VIPMWKTKSEYMLAKYIRSGQPQTWAVTKFWMMKPTSAICGSIKRNKLTSQSKNSPL
jgi:hypothetical protein